MGTERTGPVEVICHGDYAPHNVVLRGSQAVGTARVDFMTAQATAGNAAFAGHIAAGHDVLYRTDGAYLHDQRAVFERHLV